ncbi:hypothetical protein IAU59_006969 [Kwoniella sp. CBS 9459]
MALTSPLFCSICSAPCLLPRLQLPTTLEDAASIGAQEHDAGKEWLNTWCCLRVSSGIVDPASFLFHHFGETTASPLPLAGRVTSRIDQDQLDDGGASKVPPKDHRRCVTVHAYCLTAIRSMIRQSAFSSSDQRRGGGVRTRARTHEEGVMLSWSLPRWTGHGPWVGREMRDPKAWTWSDVNTMGEGGDGRQSQIGSTRGEGWCMSVGYWGGTASQRQRWKNTGDHLESDDLVSPLSLGRLGHRSNDEHLAGTIYRSEQNSRLVSLPSHVLIRICECLLDVSESSCAHRASSKAKATHESDMNDNDQGQHRTLETPVQLDLIPLMNPNSIQSFFSFVRSCSDLYLNLDLPSWIWEALTLDSVRRYRGDLLTRWRANPSGVGSAAMLSSALDESFYFPVLHAIERTHLIRSQAQTEAQAPAQALAPVDEGDIDVGHEEERDAEKSTNAGKTKNLDLGEESIDSDVDARDIWYWWNYEKGWKSRRRVWWCVVQGCATARDADWW